MTHRYRCLMRLLLPTLLAPCIRLAAAPAAATEQRIECPAEIGRDAIRIARPPAGWTPFYLSEFEPGVPLNSAGLAWGTPSSMAMHRPDWSGKVGGRDVVRWLRPEHDAVGPVWAACYYGDRGQNDAVLARRIGPGATACAVIYPKRRGGTIAIVCTW